VDSGSNAVQVLREWASRTERRSRLDFVSSGQRSTHKVLQGPPRWQAGLGTTNKQLILLPAHLQAIFECSSITTSSP